MYKTDYNFNKQHNIDCNKTENCELFAIRMDEGVVKVKKLNNNARAPLSGMLEGVDYDPAIAQSETVPAHSKCLMKIGLVETMPPCCYGRIAPRSG